MFDDTEAFKRTPENPSVTVARRVWSAVEPFVLSLGDGAKATGTLAVGTLLLGGGIWLSWTSDWWLLSRASPIAPKLAPGVILGLLHLLRITLVITGAVYFNLGRDRLRFWWMASPFVWRTVPSGDDGDFRVEARPFVHEMCDWIATSVVSLVAGLAAVIALLFFAGAVCVDDVLADRLASFVTGDVGNLELIIGRALLILAGTAALLFARHKGAQAELRNKRAEARLFGEVA
jgi:hypothetical protein